MGKGLCDKMPVSGLWNFRNAVAPVVEYEARRRMASPQLIIRCISTLGRLFQFETCELATCTLGTVWSAPVTRLKLAAPPVPRLGVRARIALLPFT